MQTGKVSGMLRTGQGFAFIALTEIKPTYVPTSTKSRTRSTTTSCG